MKINLALLWGAVLSTMSGSLWVFNNIAWASDVENIEVRLIKRELRELRYELQREHDPELVHMIEEAIEELIDELCIIRPEDRECG